MGLWCTCRSFSCVSSRTGPPVKPVFSPGGTAKLFWGWQTLAALFLEPFFGVHEFAQRFAVWIAPCLPPIYSYVFSSEALPSYYAVLQPIHIRISCPSSSCNSCERWILSALFWQRTAQGVNCPYFQVASNFAHLSIWPWHYLVAMHYSNSSAQWIQDPYRLLDTGRLHSSRVGGTGAGMSWAWWQSK